MKYKILLVSHSSEVSGAPRVLLDISGCLSREKYDLRFCVPESGGIAESAIKNGFALKILPNPQIGFREQNNPLKMLKIIYQRLCFIRNFRREIKDNSYDLVYLNSSASFYAGVALFGMKVKIIWHIHEDLIPTFLNRLKCRLIVKLSHHLVFVSPSNIPCFSPFLSSQKYLILPNGVRIHEMEHFTTDDEYRRRYDYKISDQIVAMLSFISRRKGVDILLKALGSILPKHPMVKGVIAGERSNTDIQYLNELDTMCQIPELKNRIFFPGHCTHVPSFLESVSVFVLPSRNDPMPLVLLEAMACGKAIVASDVGCVREMLDPPHCGIVVPPENPEVLAEEIGKILVDPELRRRLGQNARKRVVQNYSMDIFCKKINLLIKDVLENNPHSSE